MRKITYIQRRRIVLMILTALFYSAASVEVSFNQPVTGLLENPPSQLIKYTVFELHLGANDPGQNPYTVGPEVTAVFRGPDQKSFKVKGYWDGGNIFSIRFSPILAGSWTYSTISEDAGLDGVNGSFVAINPTADELKSNNLYHGFLKPVGYGWKLGENTPFLPVGDTQWSFSEEFYNQEWQEWVQVLQERGFNSFLGCIWLAIYDRAGIAPFIGSPGDDRLNEAFFDRLDEWIRYANEHGILMGLTIGGFPDNSRWFSLFNTKDRNARWFMYCVRRYAAFNVRWVLYGEVDEMNPTWASWDDNAKNMAQLIKDEDPYDHPVGSHHRTIDRATARDGNIDYLCIQSNRKTEQSEGQYLTTIDYRQYGKPLWFEEYWYENNEGLEPGIRNTYLNFVSGMAFPTMGSLMRAIEENSGFVPKQAAINGQNLYEYLMAEDVGLIYMQHFKDFIMGFDTWDFSPAPEKIKNPGHQRQCGRFGNTYAVFMPDGGQVTLDLTDAVGTFLIEKMNIYTGKRSLLPEIEAGDWRTVDSHDSTGVILWVNGGNIPHKLVINSPLPDHEFLPGEKVYVNGQGNKITWQVRLSGKRVQSLASTDKSDFTFQVPGDAEKGQVIEILLLGQDDSLIQAHRTVEYRQNNPPFVTNSTTSAISGESCGINLFFSDPDGPGPYTYYIIEGPSHGRLSGKGNDRTYTPDAHFTGTDQFIWQVDDGLEKSRPKRVSISVIPQDESKNRMEKNHLEIRNRFVPDIKNSENAGLNPLNEK